jgi:hypothetical protein
MFLSSVKGMFRLHFCPFLWDKLFYAHSSNPTFGTQSRTTTNFVFCVGWSRILWDFWSTKEWSATAFKSNTGHVVRLGILRKLTILPTRTIPLLKPGCHARGPISDVYQCFRRSSSNVGTSFVHNDYSIKLTTWIITKLCSMMKLHG